MRVGYTMATSVLVVSYTSYMEQLVMFLTIQLTINNIQRGNNVTCNKYMHFPTVKSAFY